MQWRIQDSPEGGGANLEGGSANLIFWPIFPKNCMKMKTNWTERDPPMQCKAQEQNVCDSQDHKLNVLIA